jgi:hypothetical protein
VCVQFQGPSIAAARSELKFAGPDFTAIGTLTIGQRMGGTGASLAYFQSVTQRLALGGVCVRASVPVLAQTLPVPSRVDHLMVTSVGSVRPHDCSFSFRELYFAVSILSNVQSCDVDPTEQLARKRPFLFGVLKLCALIACR